MKKILTVAEQRVPLVLVKLVSILIIYVHELNTDNGYLPFSNRFELCFQSLGYFFEKITSKSCCVTNGGFDLIGGFEKSSVTNDECRELCSTYDWCHGIRIKYDTGRRKKRGVRDEQCRLLSPYTDITISGWDHLNKNNWKEAPEWKDCSGAYGKYDCYQKYAPG